MMDSVNDTNDMEDIIDQDDAEDVEEKEEFVKSSDIEEKKRAINNEFNAEGNTANTQIFIQNLENINTLYKPSPQEFDIKTPLKQYDLRMQDECSEFIETYKKSEYLAIAILLSVFEVVPLTDLPDLQKNILEFLPEVETSNSEGLGEHHTQSNPYISLNTILAVVQGKKFVTEDGQSCVGLGENSEQALINILEQFPLLRRSIVSWLIHLHEVQKYRTTFEVCQVAVAFSRIVSIDINDAKNRIFLQLYSNPRNVWLLGALAYKLYENAVLREDIENVIVQWITSDSIWLWKSACLVYVSLKENDIPISFEALLVKRISKKIMEFKRNDLNFISRLLIRSQNFRTLIINVLHITYRKTNTRTEKVTLAQIYINLVRRSYYLVNSLSKELPLVVCDTKRQQEYLSQIVSQIMSTYCLRKQLYAIMEAYLKELSKYDFSPDTISHISAYFYNMSYADVSYQDDVFYFLDRCQNKVAQQISSRLFCTYKRGELYLHE